MTFWFKNNLLGRCSPPETTKLYLNNRNDKNHSFFVSPVLKTRELPSKETESWFFFNSPISFLILLSSNTFFTAKTKDTSADMNNSIRSHMLSTAIAESIETIAIKKYPNNNIMYFIIIKEITHLIFLYLFLVFLADTLNRMFDLTDEEVDFQRKLCLCCFKIRHHNFGEDSMTL